MKGEGANSPGSIFIQRCERMRTNSRAAGTCCDCSARRRPLPANAVERSQASISGPHANHCPNAHVRNAEARLGVAPDPAAAAAAAQSLRAPLTLTCLARRSTCIYSQHAAKL